MFGNVYSIKLDLYYLYRNMRSCSLTEKGVWLKNKYLLNKIIAVSLLGYRLIDVPLQIYTGYHTDIIRYYLSSKYFALKFCNQKYEYVAVKNKYTASYIFILDQRVSMLLRLVINNTKYFLFNVSLEIIKSWYVWFRRNLTLKNGT